MTIGSKGLAPEDVPDEPDEVLFETIRRCDVVILVELPTGEAEQATRTSPSWPHSAWRKPPTFRPGSRLIDLNVRRNTSVRGEWVEVLDRDALEDAIRAARELLNAVRHGLTATGIDVS